MSDAGESPNREHTTCNHLLSNGIVVSCLMFMLDKMCKLEFLLDFPETYQLSREWKKKNIAILSVSFAENSFPFTSRRDPLRNKRGVRKVNIHHVRLIEKFLCLLWQHCRRPWSFTCEVCSFDSGRTGFVWVRHVWNGSADPKSCQMRSAFPYTISQRKRWTSSGNSQTNCCCLW